MLFPLVDCCAVDMVSGVLTALDSAPGAPTSNAASTVNPRFSLLWPGIYSSEGYKGPHDSLNLSRKL